MNAKLVSNAVRCLSTVVFLVTCITSARTEAASYLKTNGTIVDPIRTWLFPSIHLYTGRNLEPGANLRHASLTNADLTDVDLAYTHLDGANLAGANLSNANLYNTNLTDADLTNANLTNANLTDANLTDANLWGADLSWADPFAVAAVISPLPWFIRHGVPNGGIGNCFLHSDFKVAL